MTRAALLGLALVVPTVLGAQQPPPDAVLVRCAAGSSALCLSTRVDLTPESARRLMGADPAVLTQGWKARFGRDSALIGVGQPLAQGTAGRILLLLDVSGSMKGPRIGTARLVLRQFLRSLDSLPKGSVRVAIAPFGSIDVSRRIKAARFSIPDSTALGIDQLPAPEKENTGLYSAVIFATERLRSELAGAPAGAVGLLVIVTDGNNDIRPGDDPGLLEGQAGLAQAARTVDESPIGVGIVGIGDLDRQALRSLAGPRGQAFVVGNSPGAFELSQPLGQIRRMLWTAWDVNIRLASSSRADLGRAVSPVTVDLALAKDRVPGGTAVWRPPLVGLPAFAGTAPSGVLSGSLGRTEGAGSWIGSALLAAFLALLLVEVWIVLPRFLWPPVVPAGVPAGQPAKEKPVAPSGALRSDLKEAPPRKPSDVTASRARRA